jgi:AraC-like DNA-binding protein
MRLPSPHRWKSSLAPLPRGSSGIGDLTLAGTLAGSRGISRQKPRVFDQWAVVYLVGGAGSYHDDRGTEMPVRPGDVILVFPELAHSYGPPAGGEWDELYVCFRGPAFEAWRESGLLDIRRPVFPWHPPERGLPLMQEFFGLLGRRGVTMLDATCQWQCMMARIFANQAEAPRGAAQPEWFLHALDLLERRQVEGERGLRAVAAECGMGYENFRKKFALIAGQPPGRYALGRRIERARSLLARHRFTNKELADLLGFHDEFHFAKTFRKLTGRTPREHAG